MDRIDHAFAALSHRMSSLSAPERPAAAPPSIASLIDRVNAARRLHQQELRR